MSVYGTGQRVFRQYARIFSGACSSTAIARRMRLAYSPASPLSFPPKGPALPFNAPFRRCAGVSLLRLRCISYTPGCGILTACPSTLALLLGLRSRLTLNRLALFRNPWSFGEGVSRPLCRYLYLHLLFHRLQHTSRNTFADDGMLPYQSYFRTIPRLRHRTYARLLSMQGRSTSELLRTL